MRKKDKEIVEEIKRISTIPPFVLKRIFRRDCVEIQPEGGFILTLDNKISPFKFYAPDVRDYVHKLHFYVDDAPIDMNKFWVEMNDNIVSYHELSKLDGTLIKLGDEIKLIYKSKEEKFEPIEHIVHIKADLIAPIEIKFKIRFQPPFSMK